MEKIKAALKRVQAVTEDTLTTIEIYDDGSWKLRGRVGDIESFGRAESMDQIVEAIDRYAESKKPKPRPIPEIVRELKECYQKYHLICHDDIGKLLDELSNSPAATFPF